MLILTRKIGQSIKIGDEISITVVSMRGEQVRLGIDAPKEIPVDREEIAERRAARQLETRDEADAPSMSFDDHDSLLRLRRST